MSNVLKQIDIHIDKELTAKEPEQKTEIFNFKHLKKVLKPYDTIIDISSNNYNLLNDINKYLKYKCNIISFSPDFKKVINGRRYLSGNNSIIFNSVLREKDLKENIANIVIGKNILGNKINYKSKLKEINKILKNNGYFFFIELISLNKPHFGFKSYFKKHKKHDFNLIVFDYQKKLKLLKDCEYEIKIVGNGNFYFDSHDVNSLQEFCDLLGYKSEDRKNILTNILAIIIKGKINKK